MKAFVKATAMNDPVTALDMTVPSIDSNEILIKVEAIGVGVHDEYFHAPNVAYPYVIGIEASGSVHQIGQTVKGYKAGDRVAFISMMQPKGGTWAEYTVVSDRSLILPIPKGMSFTQAAAIPVVANTALKIMKSAGLSSGDTIFIAGGAGAIGSLLIQLAKKQGATVFASASSKNHSLLKELGADYAVDYHDHGWQDQVLAIIPKGVDVGVGIHPGTPKGVQPVIKDDGVLIAVSGDQLPTDRGVTLKGVFNDVDVRPELLALMQAIQNAEIIQTIEKIYSFSDALEALSKVKTRHNRGKLVISVHSLE